MKSIFTVIDGQLRQQNIDEFDTIPDGWTEDLESLKPQLDSHPGDEVNELKAELEKTREELLQTQEAMADFFEQVTTGGTGA